MTAFLESLNEMYVDHYQLADLVEGDALNQNEIHQIINDNHWCQWRFDDLIGALCKKSNNPTDIKKLLKLDICKIHRVCNNRNPEIFKDAEIIALIREHCSIPAAVYKNPTVPQFLREEFLEEARQNEERIKELRESLAGQMLGRIAGAMRQKMEELENSGFKITE